MKIFLLTLLFPFLARAEDPYIKFEGPDKKGNCVINIIFDDVAYRFEDRFPANLEEEDRLVRKMVRQIVEDRRAHRVAE